jgi:23S rRNA pseudouridine2604 synthase
LNVKIVEDLGYDVIALKRIRIINISLDIPMGRYRDLTDAEIKELNELIEPSSKTEEASLQEQKLLKRRTEFIKRDDPDSRKKEIIKFQDSPVFGFKIIINL